MVSYTETEQQNDNTECIPFNVTNVIQAQENEQSGGSDSDLEILSVTTNCDIRQNTKEKHPTPSMRTIISKLFGEKTVQCEDKNNESGGESDDDDCILIQAGDKWVENDAFLQNKEEFKKDIALKRKESISKHIKDIDSESEEDLVVLNKHKTSNQDICPLTLKKIQHPVKNRLCSHIYERSAILNYRQYLLANDKPAKCPQGGCQAALFGF